MSSLREFGPVQGDWLTERVLPQGGGSEKMPVIADSVAGQLHFGLNAREWGYFDVAKQKWLSIAAYEKEGGSYAIGHTNWLWKDYFNTAGWKFDGANIGWTFPFDVDLCAMAIWSSSSATGTVGVFGGASAIAGATISLSAATTNQDDSYAVATIAAGTLIGLKTTSGSMNAGHVSCIFRRVLHE